MLYQYTIGEVKDLEEKADEKYENMDTPSSSENEIEVEVSQQQQDDVMRSSNLKLKFP